MNAVRQELRRLQVFARERIPVAAAMQVEFLAYGAGTLTLRAPLAPNVNHHGTAFGGSQYALAAIGGWGLAKLALAEAGMRGDAVIHDARATYRQPVTADLLLECRALDAGRCIANCRKHGRGTLRIRARIDTEAGAAMVFEGKFFVRLGEGGDG